MNPVRQLELFLLRVLGLGAVVGYLLSLFRPPSLPLIIQDRPYACSVAFSLAVQLLDVFFIYPKFRDPLRDVPNIGPGERNRGQILYESPRGKSALRWMEKNPDAQLLKMTGRMPGMSPMLVCGPDALRDVLNTHSYDFQKPWGVRAFLGRAIGWGLIMAEGPQHKAQKKALTPGFHVWRIRELYSLMWEKTQIFLEEVDKDVQKHAGDDGFAVIELSEWSSRLTLDIIGPTAIGRDFKSLTAEENPIADAFLELLRPEVRRLFFFSLHFMIPEWIIRRLPLRENDMLNKIGGYLRGVCSDIIREKKSHLQKSGDVAEHDILSRIIQTGEFTDAEVADQMLTFLAAGHETTASALTWACYLCAKHPEIQRELRAEIHANLPSHESSITHDLLEGLPYLNGVCEETLRLYPTVPATVREAVAETTVAGYRVPRGTAFLLVPYAVNRHPNFWADPHRFAPERWIDEVPGVDGTGAGTKTRRPNKTGGTSTNFAELTFLHGPRACIGRDFAKAELRCAVAGVIGRFEIELHTREEPRVQGVITMKPEGGMYLRFKPIQGW